MSFLKPQFTANKDKTVLKQTNKQKKITLIGPVQFPQQGEPSSPQVHCGTRSALSLTSG